MSAERNLPAAPRGARAGALVAVVMTAAMAAAVGFGAGWLLGARRIVLAAKSPAGDAVAFVLEGRCAAGVCQTLRIGTTGSTARVVESLSGPEEQATEIAWAPDGGRVGFLVNGYQLRVFDAHTGKNLGALTIVPPDGAPPSRIARGVTFSSNGAAITFDDCPRDHSGCKPGMLAVKTQ